MKKFNLKLAATVEYAVLFLFSSYQFFCLARQVVKLEPRVSAISCQ